MLGALVLSLPSAAVQQLNDETFEHQTQASTGMTTGSWLVTFGSNGCGSCDRFREALDSVEEELRDMYVIPAHVDKVDSAGLWKRFGISEVPATLLFAKHKLYRYTGAQDGQDLLAFARAALEGQLSAAEIPPPPSLLQIVLDKVKSIFGAGEL
ncbi:unnamed protein product [Symbiodinium natans]|uniref:Thioredoxin domain-containing protein n=1 Tax=Symbiodinium natans TaxID=878477 RepID=A0A812KR36_9DINO|nr:unnamed protein product [Symbiodinium natans]